MSNCQQSPARIRNTQKGWSPGVGEVGCRGGRGRVQGWAGWGTGRCSAGLVYGTVFLPPQADSWVWTLTQLTLPDTVALRGKVSVVRPSRAVLALLILVKPIKNKHHFRICRSWSALAPGQGVGGRPGEFESPELISGLHVRVLGSLVWPPGHISGTVPRQKFLFLGPWL